MRSMKLLGVAAVAVFAVLAMTASSAFALINPQWEEEGSKPLAANLAVTAKANGTQTLSAGIVINCTGLKLNNGELVPGNGGLGGGTDKESIVYEGCTVEPSSKVKECEARTKGGMTPAETIETLPLESSLGWKSKKLAEEEKGPSLTLFKPVTPSTFVEIEFKKKTGTAECPTGITEASVTGSVAVENIEGGLKLTNELNAPSTVITEFWSNTATVPTKQSVKLSAFGILTAKYIGKSEITAAKTWGIKL
jgi:hypothetical protein